MKGEWPNRRDFSGHRGRAWETESEGIKLLSITRQRTGSASRRTSAATQPAFCKSAIAERIADSSESASRLKSMQGTPHDMPGKPSSQPASNKRSANSSVISVSAASTTSNSNFLIDLAPRGGDSGPRRAGSSSHGLPVRAACCRPAETAIPAGMRTVQGAPNMPPWSCHFQPPPVFDRIIDRGAGCACSCGYSSLDVPALDSILLKDALQPFLPIFLHSGRLSASARGSAAGTWSAASEKYAASTARDLQANSVLNPFYARNRDSWY